MKITFILLGVTALTVLSSGCIGLTGTVARVEIHGGPSFEYLTDDSKELSGLEVTKTAAGTWKFKLDKSASTPNEAMANAILELVKKVPATP